MADYSFSTDRELALMVTRHCNIACRHCGIESGPAVKDRMSLERAEALILDAATVPNLRKITFTGGEPMMVPGDMLKLLELCQALGLETRMVTNGFWAKTPARGRTILAELRDAGLTELNFSADRFHLEFMDASTLRRALDLAAEAGFARIVSFVSASDVPPLDEFAALYGVDRDMLVDLRTMAWDPDYIEETKARSIFVFYGGLIGLGRAALHPDILRFVPVQTFPLGTPCREVVEKPVVYPDGAFQACCCAGGKIASFTVGNAFQERLPSLYDRMRARPSFRLINTHGPRVLHDEVRRACDEVELPATYTSICEMCVRVHAAVPPERLDEIASDAILRDMLDGLAGHGRGSA